MFTEPDFSRQLYALVESNVSDVNLKFEKVFELFDDKKLLNVFWKLNVMFTVGYFNRFYDVIRRKVPLKFQLFEF